jgi:hypothetical protein
MRSPSRCIFNRATGSSARALVVVLGVGIGLISIAGTNSNYENGLGFGVVEAFSPSYTAPYSNICADLRCSASSSTLYAEESSSPSAEPGADATDANTAGGISETGGQLTKGDQPPSVGVGTNTAASSEYRPLQRQWWEVRPSAYVQLAAGRIMQWRVKVAPFLMFSKATVQRHLDIASFPEMPSRKVLHCFIH